MTVTTERTTCPTCGSPNATLRNISVTDFEDIYCPQCGRFVWNSTMPYPDKTAHELDAEIATQDHEWFLREQGLEQEAQ